ncbi:MAG: hypothetical protein R6U68_06450 [Desulfobacteraceae bacterium]
MSLTALDNVLEQEIRRLESEGRAKPPERILEKYMPAQGKSGPRYKLQGIDRSFIRMNSNAYLSLSHDPELIRAADQAACQFGTGLDNLGRETIPGPHPIVPLLVRDTHKTRTLVNFLFDQGILVAGLTWPVLPKGDETIRFQINAAHPPADIDFVLEAISRSDKGMG